MNTIFVLRVVEEEPKPDEGQATKGDNDGAEAEEGDMKNDDIEDLDLDDDEDDDEDELDPPPTDDSGDEAGIWEETFKTHHDSKPYGMCVCIVIVCVCV